MRYVYIALLIVFVAVIVIFSVQNAETMTVHFLTWSTSLPRFVVVIGAYILGMASGGTVAGFVRHSVREARTKPGSAGGGTER